MPRTLPSARDALDKARDLADRMVSDFRKFKDPYDPSPEAAQEGFILGTIAFFYYGRSQDLKHDHTIGAALVDSEEAMAYMAYPETVLQRLKNDLFDGQSGSIWRRAHNEWAFSWDETEEDS